MATQYNSMDKIKQLYESFLSNNIISNATDFESFKSANEDQLRVLYDTAVNKKVLSTSTDFNTFSSVFNLKKKDESQPTSPEVATESIIKEEKPTTFSDSSEEEVFDVDNESINNYLNSLGLDDVDISPVVKPQTQTLNKSQYEKINETLSKRTTPIDINDRGVATAIEKGLISDKDLVLAGYKDPENISTLDRSPSQDEIDEAKKKIYASRTKSSDEIDFAISQFKLDKPYIYEDKSSEDLSFIQNNYDVNDLKDARLNIKDFDGFLNEKGFKQDFIDKAKNFESTYGSLYDVELAKEMELSRMLELYYSEQAKRDIKQQKLTYEKEKGIDPNLTDDKYSFWLSQSNIDQSQLTNYYSKHFPKLTDKLLEVNKKNADLYQKYMSGEFGASDFFKESGNQFYEGIETRLQNLSASAADLIGFSNTADGIRFQIEQEKLSEGDNLSYSYASGKNVVFNGKNYLVDAKNNIYDSDLKIRVTSYLDNSTQQQIIKLAESTNREDFSLSTKGMAFETSNVLGDMGVQIGLQYAGGGLLKGATSLSKAASLRNTIGYVPSTTMAVAENLTINRGIASAILAQSTLGASSGYEDTLSEARAAGFNDKEAVELAKDASIQMARLYALTAPISPQTKATEAIFGKIRSQTIKDAIRAYRDIGKKGFIDTFEKAGRKSATYFEEGLKEFFQENVQQAGEVLLVNKNTNELAGVKFKKDDITIDDFINTSILSFTAGIVMPLAGDLSSSGRKKAKQIFGIDSSNRLQSLIYLAQNQEKLEKLLNSQKSKGIYTEEEVSDLLSDVRVFSDNMSRIPSNLKPKTILEITSDLQSIRRLEEKKKSLDEAFHPDINDEIASIRESIITKTKQDAIQEQTAGQVPVQSETAVSETVEEGTPKAESEVVIEQTTQEEIDNRPISERQAEAESKIKRKKLFGGVGGFSTELGNSDKAAVPVSHNENNGIEIVEYAHPDTGSVDVIVTGKTGNDFVGFYRIYENGKPTNKWSSKFKNQSRNKEDFKTMISGVQNLLPEGHQYTETTNISTDGLRVWEQQLSKGYEIQTDENGNIITDRVAINGDAISNVLGVDVDKGSFKNIKATKEEFENIKKVLTPYMEKLGLTSDNIHYVSGGPAPGSKGSVRIDLPVLKKSEVVTEQVTQEETAPQTIIENAEALAYKPEEVVETTDAAAFAASQAEAIAQRKDDKLQIAPLTQQDAQKIIDEGGKLFMTEDGKAGAYVTADGYMGGLFKQPGANRTQAAKVLQEARIKAGGKFFDAFGINNESGKGTTLEDIYIKNGFRPVARMTFNPEVAPPGWENTNLKNRPDNVFFVYDPTYKATKGEGQRIEDYDKAYELAKNKANETKAGNRLFNEPLKAVKEIADRYYKRVFGKERPRFEGARELDVERAKRISDAFEAMKNDPNNPEVKKAYEALAKETIEQYKDFIDAGYVVEINNEEPYANSAEMIEDLRVNKRIKIFSTESGFGDNKITDKQRSENPLLRSTDFTDSNGVPMLVNDLFRAIHDFYGHAELGNSFGPKGEENAWNVHARMFSPLARRAMTTETRGQNSWVNFSGVNKKIEALRDKARKLREQGAPESKIQKIVDKIYEIGSFAEQKIGLLPEEFSNLDTEQDTIESEVQKLKDLLGKKQFSGDRVNTLNDKLAIITQANKAIKSLSKLFPDVKINLFYEERNYHQAIGVEDFSAGSYDGNNTININLTRATKTTVAHEVLHAILAKSLKSDKAIQDLTKRFVNSLLRTQDTRLIKLLQDAVGDIKQYESVQNEEVMSELFGVLAGYGKKLDKDTRSLIKRFLDRIAKFFGLKQFTDAELINVLNTLSKSIATGTEITELGILNKTSVEGVLTDKRQITANTRVDDIIRIAKENNISDAAIRKFLQEDQGLSVKQADDAVKLYNEKLRKEGLKKEGVRVISGKNAKKLYNALMYVKSARANRPKSMVIGREDKAGAIEGAIKRAYNTIGKLDKIMKKMSKPEYERVMDELDKYLRGNKNANLPDNIKAVAFEMRTHLDNLSRKLIEVGAVPDVEFDNLPPKKKQELIDRAGSEADARAEYKTASENILGNIGEYLNRSYAVHTDKNWKDKVSEKVVEDAKNYLRKSMAKTVERQAKKENRDFATMLEQEVNAVIDRLLNPDEAKAFFSSGSTDAKKTGILTRRLDIAQEIRALMGEEKSPAKNYIISVQKIASLAAQQTFLNNVREAGLGVWLFENESDAPKGFRVKISSETSKTMNPLNGLFTSPEIAKAFNDAYKKPEGIVGDVIKLIDFLYLKPLGVVKYSKTILSPGTHSKNIIGNGYFMLANGYINPKDFIDAGKIVWNEIKNGDNEALREKYIEYIEAGVINSSVALKELKNILYNKVENENDFEDRVQSRLYGKNYLKKGFELAEKAYQIEDDYFKIISYEVNKRQYSKVLFKNSFENLTGKQQKEVIDIAKEITKNTLPNYERIAKIRELLKFMPIGSNFLSFHMEALRVSYNTIELAVKEVKDPRTAAIGVRRLIGISSAIMLSSGLLGSLLGFGGDDDGVLDAVRKLLPYYAENSKINIVSTSGNEIIYQDLSASSPYGAIEKAFIAYSRGESLYESIIASLKEALGPFFADDIIISELMKAYEVISSQGIISREGGEAVAKFLYNTTKPGGVSSAEKTFIEDRMSILDAAFGREIKLKEQGKLKEAIGQFTGFGYRVVKKDATIKRKLYEIGSAGFGDYKSGKARAAEKDYRNRLREFKDGKVSEVEVEKAYNRSNKMYKEAINEAIEIYKSGLILDIDKENMKELMKATGFNINEIEKISIGEAPDMRRKEETSFESEYEKLLNEKIKTPKDMTYEELLNKMAEKKKK